MHFFTPEHYLLQNKQTLEFSKEVFFLFWACEEQLYSSITNDGSSLTFLFCNSFFYFYSANNSFFKSSRILLIVLLPSFFEVLSL